jgi:serine-type D-Ala-D-Ala carboxypeptidase (penicillin-binding protein 5/6)
MVPGSSLTEKEHPKNKLKSCFHKDNRKREYAMPFYPLFARSGLLGLLLLVALSVPTVPSSQAAEAPLIETTARQAIIVDMETGTTLFEKNADQRMPTSSMSKIMTAYMTFEHLKAGQLSLDGALPVSDRAWRVQGSKMFVELGNSIKVEDLIRGMIIQSGNDACVVLAEGLAGNEDSFAKTMTKRAHELGMVNSNFMNASGWPDPDHYSTARDLSLLATRLIKDFPEYMHYYGEKDFTYHGIKQGNRNPLLYRNMGVDGLKTGHTDAAGYGLIATGVRDGRRLVMVVNGLPNMQARADESARLLEWAWRSFAHYSLFQAGETVDALPVWMGVAAKVPVIVQDRVLLTMTHEQRQKMRVSVIAQSPLPAPVRKGDRVATVRVAAPGMATIELPLLAGADVPELGFLGRLTARLADLLFGASAVPPDARAS